MHRAGRVGLAFTSWVYAAATLAAGLTPPGTTLHNASALTALLVVPVAMAVAQTLSRSTRSALVVLTLATFAAWPLGVGLGERITVYAEITFLSWVALPLGCDAHQHAATPPTT